MKEYNSEQDYPFIFNLLNDEELERCIIGRILSAHYPCDDKNNKERARTLEELNCIYKDDENSKEVVGKAIASIQLSIHNNHN